MRLVGFVLQQVTLAIILLLATAADAENSLAKKSDKKTHIVILSDRLLAMSVTLGSICRFSKKVEDIHFHIITKSLIDVQIYFDHLPQCEDAHLDLISIDSITKILQDEGFSPIWAKEKDATAQGEKLWGIQTPYRNNKHAHPMNIARFYLPYIPSLAVAKKLIFLDDDVIVNKDIATLLDLKFPPNVAVLTGCFHWTWNANSPGNYEASTNITIKETGYIGNHGAICEDGTDHPYGCVSGSFEKDLALVSQQLKGNKSSFANHPLNQRAWNMGFTVFDVDMWKALQLSHHYEKWVDAVLHEQLFETDTLAFGLGLAYFALADAVGCYETYGIHHLTGLTFVPEESLTAAGWPFSRMKDEAFALHYNGANKPWEKPLETYRDLCKGDYARNAIDLWQETCVNVTICTCPDADPRRLLQYQGKKEGKKEGKKDNTLPCDSEYGCGKRSSGKRRKARSNTDVKDKVQTPTSRSRRRLRRAKE